MACFSLVSPALVKVHSGYIQERMKYMEVNGDLANILVPWETAAKRRRKRDRDEILNCIGSYAIVRIKELITVGEDEAPDNFLGYILKTTWSRDELMEASEEQLHEHSEKVARRIYGLFFAGFLSTASRGAWCMHDLLAEDPAFIKCVRSDTDTIIAAAREIGPDEPPRVEDHDFLNACFTETAESILLGSAEPRIVPSGFVAVTADSICNDPDLYGPDYKKYDPNRYYRASFVSKEESNPKTNPGIRLDSVRAPPLSMTSSMQPSFGVGTHQCAGRLFAYRMVTTFITSLFESFDVELVEAEVCVQGLGIVIAGFGDSVEPRRCGNNHTGRSGRTSRKRPPGPVGTSCLTCRRRHKKCDERKPICERCWRGGYECLGYDHNRSGPVTQIPQNSPRNDRTSMWNEVPRGKDTAINPQLRNIYDGTQILVPVKVAFAPRCDILHPFEYYDTGSLIHDTFPPTKSKNSTAITGVQQPVGSNTTTPQHNVLFSSPLLFTLASQIPKSISLPSDMREVVEYVMSHLDRMINLMYFKPRREHISTLQRESMWRLSTCSFARRSMFMDAKITDSVLEGSDVVYFNSFTLWIEEFEQDIHSRIAQPLTSYELQERLSDILEVLLLKVILFDASTTYQLLCRAMPSFLQRVFSDPALKHTQQTSTSVSIAHLLASPRFGPAYFMVMDIMASMVYGIPQLVDYDTDTEPFHLEPHPLEWIDCFPGEFQIMLAKINVYRDRGPIGRDWRDIEQGLFSWMSRPKFEPKVLESWKSIAWMAVQETWRHTLLIYLYLVVCRVSTDDPRVQSSLRQLIQLMGTIRRQDPPVANVQLFAQLLIAGICSHSEKQRKLVRQRLGSLAETRFWMFRGPDIVPVLEHLWCGAAMGGKAITWDDYTNSRRAMLPLSTLTIAP
ncbi:hypothetical protein OPQ81_011802 [Rhizoctonia solani]|nr:hypothetical protein OPQ81_011802 [Rhizoctonia solani]